MNICKRFECDTCSTLIDCRIGMSNRDIQPFQFSCPECEENISFTFGSGNFNLQGAVEIDDFKGPFDGSNPFVDLHLDFPVSFGEYKPGDTAFFRVLHEIGQDAYSQLKLKLDVLNVLYPKQRELRRLISQYKRNDIKAFKKVSKKIPEAELKSTKIQDVLASLYKATSIMSSPFTIHEHNEELSHETPRMLQGLYEQEEAKTEHFFKSIISSGFLKHLHHDTISLYPKLIDLDLPIRPALYYDYADESKLKKIPARISTSDFDKCSNIYKDLAEVFSRQLVIVAGLNNLLKRGDSDLFDDSVKLNKSKKLIKDFSSLDNYANVDLGRKIDAIDDSFYIINPNAIDNKLRNGIAHYKYEYSAASQLITYYPSKEGMKREKYHELYFIEFLRKILLLFREVHSLNHIIKALLYFNIFILKQKF